PDRDRVPRKKAVTPIVMSLAKLRLAHDRLKKATTRMKTKITATDGNGVGRRCVGPANHAIATSVCAVDPIIQAPVQRIGPQLLRAGMETGPLDAANVGPTVAVRVFEIQDIRGRRHEDS